MDFETGKEEQYSCTNPVWKRRKCKFHGGYYLQSSKRSEFETEFKKIIIGARINGTALKCIGYHFPVLDLAKICNDVLNVMVYFTDAKFHGEVDFSKIEFKKETSFTDAVFSKTTSFSGSIFEKDVKFSNTNFDSNSNSFQHTEFQKNVDFSYNKITNGKFNHAKFKNANFNNRIFKGKTSFVHATFEGNYLFEQTTFHNVDFSESIFEKNINFDNTVFRNYAIFLNMICDESIKFNGNISNISFQGMDIKKIRFGNKITWKRFKNKNSFRDKIKRKFNWTENSDFKIYDERQLEKQLKNNRPWWKRQKTHYSLISLESIKNIYRDLRESFDLTLRYETSGEFHVRELELKRKFQEKQKEQRSITSNKNFLSKHFSIYWLYNILAQYGQSYHRPICFATTVIAVATCYFISNEISTLKDQSIHSILEIILKSTTRSVAGIIPFDILGTGMNDDDKILRIILLPITATFFISIRRRLERKLRH